MTTVGIISDTHGTLHEAAYNALADCDFIIHAGDIGSPKILAELKTLAPVFAVYGNNDFPEDYPSDVKRFAKPEIDGMRFLVSHYPQDIAISSFGSSALAPGEPIPHVRIHGHTHVPKLERGAEARPSDVLMCPGSASRPRGEYPRSVGKMIVDSGKIADVWVETLSGNKLL